MAIYTSESRERVREAADFVELVSSHTDLRRAGPTRYEGLCPFHEERTPSFGIDPQRKLYHCFGCGASGDLFTFVQETEKIGFREALELLAERYGIDLEREADDPRALELRRRRERLYALLERACAFYERCLRHPQVGASARAYLRERGLGEEILASFRVGLAPEGGDAIVRAASREGFSAQELRAVGLASAGPGGALQDRFRARITFPLADERGRVIGFGARILPGGQGPKYLNSSESEIYHKGAHLYGAHLARVAAAREGSVILCEGYTDVIAMHQAGFANTVGLMGTALTEPQVRALGRLAPRVLMALDADSAGQGAMLRAAKVAGAARLQLDVIRLGGGGQEASEDPADVLRSGGAQAMSQALAAAIPFMRFRVETVLERGDLSSASGRDRVLEALRPLIAALPASALRIELVGLIASRLQLSGALVEHLLAGERGGDRAARARRAQAPAGSGAGRREPAGTEAGGRAPLPAARRAERAERAFLALCLALPPEGGEALRSLAVEEAFTDADLRAAARRLQAADLADPLHMSPPLDREQEALIAALLAEGSALAAAAGCAQQEASSGRTLLCAQLEVQRLQLELAALDRAIHAARSHRAGIAQLAARRLELKRAFDEAQERALEGDLALSV